MATKPKTTAKPENFGKQLDKVLADLKTKEEAAAQETINAMIAKLTYERFSYQPEEDEGSDPSYWVVDLHQEGLTEWSFARFENTQAFKEFSAELIRRGFNFYRATDGEYYYSIEPN